MPCEWKVADQGNKPRLTPHRLPAIRPGAVWVRRCGQAAFAMDATTEVVGDLSGGMQEKPIQPLDAHLSTFDVPKREAAVLTQIVELARVVLRLDHRLNHIRYEADLGEPSASWEEVRRAAFATALACYELDRLRAR